MGVAHTIGPKLYAWIAKSEMASLIIIKIHMQTVCNSLVKYSKGGVKERVAINDTFDHHDFNNRNGGEDQFHYHVWSWNDIWGTT